MAEKDLKYSCEIESSEAPLATFNIIVEGDYNSGRSVKIFRKFVSGYCVYRFSYTSNSVTQIICTINKDKSIQQVLEVVKSDLDHNTVCKLIRSVIKRMDRALLSDFHSLLCYIGRGTKSEELTAQFIEDVRLGKRKGA